jgi:hypothetical protein
MTSFFHRRAIELDVRSTCGKHVETEIARPLKEVTKIVAVSVEGAPSVAREKRRCGQVRVLRRVVR